MGPKELADAMAANKKFRDKITGKVFIFISVDIKGNVVGLTEDGSNAESHVKNLEVVESSKSNQSNISEKINEQSPF